MLEDARSRSDEDERRSRRWLALVVIGCGALLAFVCPFGPWTCCLGPFSTFVPARGGPVSKYSGPLDSAIDLGFAIALGASAIGMITERRPANRGVRLALLVLVGLVWFGCGLGVMMFHGGT